MLERTLLQSA